MELKKYRITIFTLLAVLAFVYFFTKILIYLVLATVLALIGAPIVSLLTRIKIGKLRINQSMAALFTLCFFFLVIYIIGVNFLPPFINQITFLTSTNLHDVVSHISFYYPSLKHTLNSFGTEKQIMDGVSEQMNHFINLKNIGFIVNNTISYFTSILGGLFSILFITFFFLKDERLVVKFILLITPSEYDNEMKDILRTSKKMLSQYFVGLFVDMIFVTFLVSGLMWFFGIKNAIVIGCLAGVMNVIPYIGPIITLFLAVFLGISGCIQYNEYEMITSTVSEIIVILIGTNLLDTILIQPMIFSNTVKAHPLEIFLVILMAGILGGILGMVVAIPCYTLLRIIAKEFLDHFKFFKKLTEKIPE